MRQVIRRQHKALATEDACVLSLRRYMKGLRQMPAQLPSEKRLEKFLTDLALERGVSGNTQNQVFNALVYSTAFWSVARALTLSATSNGARVV